MSRYGSLSSREGHSKWFLQRTLAEHDRSMDDPWMQMIYNQSFTVEQYVTWLAQNHAVFAALEEHLASAGESGPLRAVHDAALARAPGLEADLRQLLGAGWRDEAAGLVRRSLATQSYLEHLAGDVSSPWLVLAHHFLQYNAVLSGGAYLGRMVSEKFCVPHGAPGVQFYAFAGVQKDKSPARVQKYLKDFDTIEISEEDRGAMLAAMRHIYEDTEAMMRECFELSPAPGIDYAAAKGGGGREGPAPIPAAEQLELGLAELRAYAGADGGRILLSLAGELLDISGGREMYGPGQGYALLAGHDVTRCLATMSLDPAELDDLAWKPSGPDDEQALEQWREKLKAKYPVAGRLRPGAADAGPAGGGSAAGAGAQGSGPPPKFMAGKSLIQSVEESKGTEESFLSRICPLHWDSQTMKCVLFVAVVSWLNGVFIGWKLRKTVRS